MNCPLCDGAGGRVVARTAQWRLVHADEPGFPAFYRLVWNAHVPEFSELTGDERSACMEVVAQVEATMREHLAPRKVNLASLGNMVPHLHWHLIARYDWDSRFPDAVWAPPRREADPQRIHELTSQLPALETLLHSRLTT